jgi:hypothetical protein
MNFHKLPISVTAFLKVNAILSEKWDEREREREREKERR